MARAPISWFSTFVEKLQPLSPEEDPQGHFAEHRYGDQPRRPRPLRGLPHLLQAVRGVFWYPASGNDFTPLGLDYLDDLPGYHLASGDRARGGKCLLLWMNDYSEPFDEFDRCLRVFRPEGRLKAFIDRSSVRRFQLPLPEPVEDCWWSNCQVPRVILGRQSQINSIPVTFFRVSVRPTDGSIGRTRSYWVCFSGIRSELFLEHVILPYRIPVRAVSTISVGGDRFHNDILPTTLDNMRNELGMVSLFVEDFGEDCFRAPLGFHKIEPWRHRYWGSNATLWLRPTARPKELRSPEDVLLPAAERTRSCFVSSVSFDLQPLVRLSHRTDTFIYAGEAIAISHVRWQIERQIEQLGLGEVLQVGAVGDVFQLSEPLTSPDGGCDQAALAVELSILRTVGTENRKLRVVVLHVDPVKAYKQLFSERGRAPLVLCTISPKSMKRRPSQIREEAAQCDPDYRSINEGLEERDPDLRWNELLLGQRLTAVPRIWIQGRCMWVARTAESEISYMYEPRNLWPYRYRRPKKLRNRRFPAIEPALGDWYTGRLNSRYSHDLPVDESCSREKAAVWVRLSLPKLTDELPEEVTLTGRDRTVRIGWRKVHEDEFAKYDKAYAGWPAQIPFPNERYPRVEPLSTIQPLRSTLDYISREAQRSGHRRVLLVPKAFEDEGTVLLQWIEQGGDDHPIHLEIREPRLLAFADLRGLDLLNGNQVRT